MSMRERPWPGGAFFFGRLAATLAFCAGVFLSPRLAATSVVPPTFSELVGRSSQIVRMKVRRVASELVENSSGRAIYTYVTCAVESTLKGEDRSEITLRFLGGTVGGMTMRVSDMPELSEGGSYVAFVAENGRAFCPLVGVMHGSYPVQVEAATKREVVLRANRRPLRSVDDVVLPMGGPEIPALAAGTPLSWPEFEAAIRNEVNRVRQ